MNLNFFKRQMAAVIEWTSQQANVLLFKYPSDKDEVKNASKLIIGPGQGVILVYEGTVTDVLPEPGIYDLATDNHPFITTLLKLRTAFESEHKLRVYFYRTSENTDQNWGTATSVKFVDPVYQFPVALGANGNFSFRLSDPARFFTHISGFSDQYITAQARVLLQSRISQLLAVQLANGQFSYQQIDAQLNAISNSLKESLITEFENLGLTLSDFRINGTVFDKATQDRINSIADITAESKAAAEGGINYVDLEKLKAMRDAAKNPSGIASTGLSLGTGLALGKIFADQQGQGANDPMVRLQMLKQLLNEGIITQEEFDHKKKEWLDKI
jgi:membrane protease subunit (stomatin/prohibitin family)